MFFYTFPEHKVSFLEVNEHLWFLEEVTTLIGNIFLTKSYYKSKHYSLSKEYCAMQWLIWVLLAWVPITGLIKRRGPVIKWGLDCPSFYWITTLTRDLCAIISLHQQVQNIFQMNPYSFWSKLTITIMPVDNILSDV